LRRLDRRALIIDGVVPLVPPPVKQPALPSVEPIGDARIIDFVRCVGVARILDAAVMVEAAQ
jgi:hypothetical protein